MRTIFSLFLTISIGISYSQCDRPMQRADQHIQVDLNDKDHTYTGNTRIAYVNNSGDALDEVYFHLYPNAFKPGSEMDVRSRQLPDPDPRILDRISKLSPSEEGELRVTSFLQDGKVAEVTHLGTIMRVKLPQPIKAGKRTVFEFEFKGQVPVQIRRSGRNNAEGVAYSMTQWYPKIAEYDQRGWHTAPYVAREFYGVWGNIKLDITIDAAYTVAATGVLKNASQIGHGYTSTPVAHSPGTRLTWRFEAQQVHDVAWSADKDYLHTTAQVPDGPLLRFFRKNDPELAANWEQLPDHMIRCFELMNERYGKYPWAEFIIAQGGDGGMEYPMFTLVTGKRSLGSLVGTSVHEAIHSWFYGALASNEVRYPWMDEGFAEYAGSKVMADLFERSGDPHASAFNGYRALVASGKEEPLSTHADHYNTNYAYSMASYNKGEVFLQQLGSVIGDTTLERGMRTFFEACKFRHPDPVDLERVMEKESGLQLDWYFDGWINTTRTLDYAVGSVLQFNDSVEVTLQRRGDQLMPVDLVVEHRNGQFRVYSIPLSLMLGAKRAGSEVYSFEALKAWNWAEPTYSFRFKGQLDQIARVVLDPTARTADIDTTNDVIVLPEGTGGYIRGN